jgi:hypothetical protein
VDRPEEPNGRRDLAAALTAPLVPAPAGRVTTPVDWDRPVPPPLAPPVGADGRLPVREITGDRAGASAPFGDDRTLPLTGHDLDYTHPAAEDDD